VKRLKQGPTEQLKRRKSRLKNHKPQKTNNSRGGNTNIETTRSQRRGP